MGATDIRPIAKGRLARWIDRITGKENGIGDLYSGTVPEGIPICSEDEQIVLGDEYGNKTVAFKTYSTTRDGLMRDEMTDKGASYQDQNVGYLELPQPLARGLCSGGSRSAAGYARSKPIAIEVYSDKITYYKEGTKDSRVLAVVYEDDADHQTTNANKPEDKVNVAQVYVENTPIRLEVEKVKESYVGKANRRQIRRSATRFPVVWMENTARSEKSGPGLCVSGWKIFGICMAERNPGVFRGTQGSRRKGGNRLFPRNICGLWVCYQDS